MSDNFLDDYNSSNIGAPSWKPEQVPWTGKAGQQKFVSKIGSRVTGKILGTRQMDCMKFDSPTEPEIVKNADGTTRPRQQLMIVLETPLRNWAEVAKLPVKQDGTPQPASEDVGHRAIYVQEKSNLFRQVHAARPAGVKLLPGDLLSVLVKDLLDTGKGNPAVLYDVKWREGDHTGEDFFASSEPEPDLPETPQDPWSTPPAPPAPSQGFTPSGFVPDTGDEDPFAQVKI